MTGFLTPYLPIAPFLSFFGISIMYFIERYNVVRVYKRPEQISGLISVVYANLTKSAIFLHCLMNYVMPNATDTRWHVVALCISGVLVITPIYTLQNLLIWFDSNIISKLQLTYKERFFDFGANYQIVNPVTRTLGIQSYLDKMYEQNIITTEERNDFLNAKDEDSGISNVIELYYSKKGQVGQQGRKSIGMVNNLVGVSSKKLKYTHLKGILCRNAPSDKAYLNFLKGMKSKKIPSLLKSSLEKEI